MGDPIPSRRIHLLREDVANRIAAGEVIDRPLSIVRELLDNALDAGARSIDVRIERGGLDEVRVTDDGAGMDAADLELCYLPHATSKIESAEDLQRTTTLGFRGEALSSIGLCATLEVTSRPPEARTGHRLQVRDGRREALEAVAAAAGTVVRVSALFEHLPGRRQFMKSAGSESAQCASAFLDKAAAFPEVSFRFISDGQPRYLLPASPLEERIRGAYPAIAFPLEVREGAAGGLAVRMVVARPEAARRDRRLLQLFVNGRRVWEYSLMQAVEYGFAGTIPGGLHPIAFVFVTADPSLVDFNVHPAKREARFRDPGALHRLIAGVAKEYARECAVPAGEGGGGWAPERPLFPVEGAGPAAGREREAGREGTAPGRVSDSLAVNLAALDRRIPQGPASAEAVSYLGQAFGLFLVASRGDRLYLIDQHAAHERLLFDRFLRAEPALQELLLPICFDASEPELEYLRGHLEGLRAAGVVVELHGGSSCEVTAMDATLEKVPEEVVAEVACGRRAEAGGLRRTLCASAACAMAVRDGQLLEEARGRELAEAALALPEPRCPHGRPVWHSISRSELFRLVKREI